MKTSLISASTSAKHFQYHLPMNFCYLPPGYLLEIAISLDTYFVALKATNLAFLCSIYLVF